MINEPYTIQNGDTLSQIAQANNTTVDKLIESNPWLTEDNRISSDGSYVLIKAGEKLNLTVDNKTTSYGIDDTNTLTPEYQTDLTTNTVIPLQPNQTISHIASKLDGINSIDLLEYNNLSLEQAKNLPVGFAVQIPKSVNNIEGGYGVIKEFEGYDGSKSYHVPNQNGGKDVVTIDKNGNLIRNDFDTNDDLTLLLKADEQSGDFVNSIDISKLEKYADSGQIISDVSPDVEESPTQEETYSQEERDEAEKAGGKIGGAVGGQIGSLIIANNNYSNIEKLLITTTTTTTFQNIGEYIALENTGGNGSEAFDNTGSDVKANLIGAVGSFIVSEYFSKNDNVSDILGMGGTFLGDMAENLLLNTLFCPTSSLQRENLYSFTAVNSHKILSSSLELEKNKILNNRFYENGKYKIVLNIDLVNNTSYNNIFYVIKNLKIA